MTAGSSARVYVSHLSGIGVFDPAGDALGKVRDLVVVLRHDHVPPRILGLVMEVQRRRIFLPMTRVTTIDAGQVVVNARLDLRRFQQRPGETLVIGELLDRRVTIATDGQPATIVDAAIEQDRNRDWRITRLHVGRVQRGFRRRGEPTTMDWSAVRGVSIEGTAEEQGVDSLLAMMDALRPADLANVLQDLPGKRRLEVARNLEDERLADVLEELPEDDRVQILTGLGLERAADILEIMEPDDAADLLSELSPEQAAVFLQEMEPDEAEDLRRLLSYGDLTAGGLMNPEPIMLLPDATVAEALARVRSPDVSPPWPRRCTWCAHRWTPRRASSSASRTSSGCCASPRRGWSPRSSTPRWSRSAPWRRCRRSPGTSRPTTSWRCPWSTSSTGCWARSPSTT